MTITERFTQLSTRFKWGIGLLAALIISPVVFMVVQGLIGLVVAGAIGLIIIHGAPWLSMKLANWKVKGIRHEANENPIETMINLLAAKRVAFKKFQENVTTAVTARSTFKTKITAFASKYPARAQEFHDQLANMTELVNRKKLALQDAQTSLENGQLKLEEMQAYWEMSQAAQAANAAAGMDTGDQFDRLKADTACDAVFESMNRAFAELEVASSLAVDDQSARVESLPRPSDPNVIEMQSVVKKVTV